MKKKLSRILIVIAAMTMMLGMMTITASAKTIKPKNAKTYVYEKGKLNKIATTVKKGNYTVVTPKAERYYLKFTAPSTKTYTFNVSGCTLPANDSYANGWYGIMGDSKYNTSSVTYLQVKTQGGKKNGGGLYFATKLSAYPKKIDSFLTSRYAKVKLNAGQTVYIVFSTSVKTLKFSVK